MNEDGLMVLSIIGLVLLLFLLPFLWVLLSRRSRGGAKFGWFLIVFFFSWLGLAAFLIFTQTSDDRSRSKSIIATVLQVSTVLFLISLGLYWFIRPDLEPVFAPNLMERICYHVLMVLTWPLERMRLPFWMWPVINLAQGIVLGCFVKLVKLRIRDDVAA